MKRFVTYLYEYTGTQKGKNTGFIKADIRDQNCQMEVHMKNSTEYTTVGEVVLIINDAGLVGIKVGEMNIYKGQGDFKTIIKMDHIADTPYTFRQIGGVGILYGDEMLSASRWVEDPNMVFSYKDIHIWQPPQLEEVIIPPLEEEKIEELQNEEEPEKVEESENAEPQEGTVIPKVEENEPDKEKVEQKEINQIENNQIENYPIDDNPIEDNRMERTDMVNELENKMMEEQSTATVQVQNIFPQEDWNAQWKNMQKIYPVVDFQKQKGGTWIKIDIKTLRELPKRNWYLGNNSFLLHGFFNYRYFILGKEEIDGKIRWLLGVPGVYQQQERVMATIFGFPEFLSDLPVDGSSVFGYWIHTLDID